MNTYKKQTKGIKLFNYLDQDVPVVWIWTIRDFLGVCLCLFLLGGAELYLLTTIMMVIVGIILPLFRYKYGLERMYQPFTPSFVSKYLKIFIPKGNERLRD